MWVKELGGKPFSRIANTMYPRQPQKTRWKHLFCAWENRLYAAYRGCPVIIGDGLKGTDDIAVPVVAANM